MEAEMSNEGSYDAPLEQIAPNTLDSEMPRASVLAAERQARINRAKQRRSEMAQNPASVSSALSSSGIPTPVKIPDTSSASLASSSASLRTELVKEAIDFLNNPRVAGKPLVSKRNFLIQRKGLTEAEVDEAVRRSNPGGEAQEESVAMAPMAPQKMIAPPPPYYGAPTMYQPMPPPTVAYPSLKSIALVVVLCVGVAGTLMHLFKKYVWAYWFPRKSQLEEKIEALETRFAKAQELITAQANDTREALAVLREYLQSQITDFQERQRLEYLQEENDKKALSELKREVSSVRHLIPSVGNFARSVKTTALQADVLETIKNELSSLKNAVKNLVSSSTAPAGSSLTSSRPLTVSQPADLPYISIPSSSQPAETEPTVNNTDSLNKSQTNPLPPSVQATAALATSTSSLGNSGKRQRPAWMQQQTSELPAWQLQTTPDASTSAAAPTETSSSAPQESTPAQEVTPPPPAEPIAQATSEALSDEPPYPESYKDVLRMIQQGITPPNVKTDVDDEPRDPTAPLLLGNMKNPSKPWSNATSTNNPLSFKVHEEDDPDMPKNIGSLDDTSDNEELELGDIELH